MRYNATGGRQNPLLSSTLETGHKMMVWSKLSELFWACTLLSGASSQLNLWSTDDNQLNIGIWQRKPEGLLFFHGCETTLQRSTEGPWWLRNKPWLRTKTNDVQRGLFSLDKKKLRGSNHCLQLHKDIVKDDRIKFSKMYSTRRGNKLQQGKAQSDLNKNFFTMMVVQH